ncbi:hypothetical protein KIPB_004841 [Kipferlia bialata]|uniref:Uncharacterized protein n=1 Tax=Kipferlia bialata TaxID=797122 RepID=A0A391NL33_9EUKA|nr:hypothetical protein KIPB_004841 [Kipferlia bialata]|eukprot:g4841.t1
MAPVPQEKKPQGKAARRPARRRADKDTPETTQANVIIPKNQVPLSEKELDEEVTRMLTANNPNAPDNIIRFSNKYVSL